MGAKAPICTRIPEFPNSRTPLPVPEFPNSRIPESPNPRIPESPNMQMGGIWESGNLGISQSQYLFASFSISIS